MRRKSKWLLILIAAIIIIQFIQPARNKNGQVLQTDITKKFTVPANVKSLLEAACYDCHSNNTHYPWYAIIQPGGWWLAKHIQDGKEEINFSDFGSYSHRRLINKLKSIENSISDGTMPLSSYILLHKDARLTNDQKKLIIEWASKLKDSLTIAN
ncbi:MULTISPECIES: heme-binding domain-containing protein [Niastella]|uniref:Heme-binding domain-containing protein n=1 Tax=Niastella soli TaxID=2821487 RepID=A0ABS3YXG6_9BACT|nr:heme-binding domain-containing protein [Niastella soli]MBO9202606.1 heme-binding domain-containing protein [Niastella soli]